VTVLLEVPVRHVYLYGWLQEGASRMEVISTVSSRATAEQRAKLERDGEDPDDPPQFLHVIERHEVDAVDRQRWFWHPKQRAWVEMDELATWRRAQP
jgi:hypothetical protein